MESVMVVLSPAPAAGRWPRPGRGQWVGGIYPADLDGPGAKSSGVDVVAVEERREPAQEVIRCGAAVLGVLGEGIDLGAQGYTDGAQPAVLRLCLTVGRGHLDGVAVSVPARLQGRPEGDAALMADRRLGALGHAAGSAKAVGSLGCG